MHLQLPGMHLLSCWAYTRGFEQATAAPVCAEHDGHTCTAAGVNINGSEWAAGTQVVSMHLGLHSC